MNNAAKWIASPDEVGSSTRNFTKEFCLAKGKTVRNAVLSASAIGTYAAFLNGCRIGKSVLAPGWTCYHTRVQYQTYDVTALLADTNTLSIGVGCGWACSHIGGDRGRYADNPAVIAHLHVTYADGTEESVFTEESWNVSTTEVLFSEIYHGETVDKTAEIRSLGHAVPAVVTTELIPQVGEDITEQERLAPVSLIVTPKGERVIDFGQNMTGYVEVSIRAPRGSRIVLHHAEVLDGDGNFYTANYRSAKNEVIYITSGGEDTFKPTYTFQGFRYVKLAEYPFDTVDLSGFRAIVVHSDLKRTGRYRCGNEKINQLYHNVLWGQKSNYLDIPTDCPQRDERLGWTGDTQVFCRTGAINYDVERFFEKWLGDAAIEQRRYGGAIPGIVPVPVKSLSRFSAAWGDAACIVPWEIYLAYGSKTLLKKHFPLMKNWVDYLRKAGPEEYLWLGGMHYGDWLAMDAGEDSYVGATSNDLIASAFFAHSTDLLVQAGETLGEDMTEYRTLHARIVTAFREYFMENGMPKEELPYTEVLINGRTEPIDTVRRGMTQTALTLILHFGLARQEERPALAAKLSELIRENGNRMTTGFVGTPYILHALSDNGCTDLAYELLFQEKNPSWLYSVCHGATTMWEHWNGIKEDGSFWSTDMNSFNHYAYGAVFDWIFGVSSGIQPMAEAPGYKEVSICPHPDRRLGFADTSIDTRNGTVRVHWYYKGDTVYYEVEIPDGITAHLTLPSGRKETLTGGSWCFAE